MTITLSTAAANAQLDALAELLDGGFIRVYTGPRPPSPDVPVKSQVLLAELRFSRPAFAAAEDGVLKARSIKADPSAANTGEVVWYRGFFKDGKTAVIDGDVGTKDADMIVNFTDIQKTATFAVNEYRLRTRPTF